MKQEKSRAVFYARVSTEEEHQLRALPKQIQECKDCIKEMGWDLVDQYVDEGKSGTVAKKRDEYQRLYEDLLEDKFDIIVIKSQDRLMRNTKDWYIFVDRLVTNGKSLYMYLDNNWYSTDNSLITGIKAILAEEYSRDLSRKLNNANRRRVERAKAGGEVSAMGNGKSLGFKIKDNKWVQDPEEIKLALLIWDLYEKYDSIRKVRDEVNNRGYRNSVGKPFTNESISRILKNEKAKGVIVLGRHHHDFDKKKIVKMPEEEWVRVSAPELAYVSEERWERVNNRLKSKSTGTRGKYGGSDPLSGKIFCAKCGSVYWRHQSNGYYNWYCGNKYAKGDVVCVGSGTVSTVKIRKIYAILSEDLEVNRKAIKKDMEKWLEELKKQLTDDSQRENTSQSLQKAQRKKDKLTEIYLEGIISKEDYRAKYEALEEEISTLEEALAPLEENEDIKDIEETLANLDNEIDQYINAPKFEESKIDFLIEHTQRITVNDTHLIFELDLIAGAIIAGKDFFLFVHDSMYFCERIQNIEYTIELRLVA